MFVATFHQPVEVCLHFLRNIYRALSFPFSQCQELCTSRALISKWVRGAAFIGKIDSRLCSHPQRLLRTEFICANTKRKKNDIAHHMKLLIICITQVHSSKKWTQICSPQAQNTRWLSTSIRQKIRPVRHFPSYFAFCIATSLTIWSQHLPFATFLEMLWECGWKRVCLSLPTGLNLEVERVEWVNWWGERKQPV